jgi:hypothetical protein
MAFAVKVVTGAIIIAYPNLLVPRPEGERIDAGKFTLMGFVDKADKATITALNNAFDQAAKNQWGDKVPGGLYRPLKDGDAKYAEDETKNAHYKGKVFFNAKSPSKPKVFDAQVQEIIDPAQIVSGDRAKLSLNVKAFDMPVNKGVGIYITGVQILGRGPFVIGGTNPKDDFTASNDDVF